MNATLSGSSKPLDFHEGEVREELQELTLRARNAFAWACARRCYPCYEAWTKSVNCEPDERVFRLLESLRVAILEMPDNSLLMSFEGLDEVIIELLPTDDSEWTSQMPLAEHALSSVAYAVRSVVCGSAQEAAWAARRAYEAADQAAINRIAGTNSYLPPDREILEDKLVQQELARQKRDVEYLKANNISIVQELAQIESLLDKPVIWA